LDDTVARRDEPKVFIQGIGTPELELNPYAGYDWGRLYLESSATLGRRSQFLARIQWTY
jgi:hypothetical protein